MLPMSPRLSIRPTSPLRFERSLCRRRSKNMVLLLNFDGVLHPNAVEFASNSAPILDAPQHNLFENNEALATLVEQFADLRLILNTWWTYVVGIDESLRQLPRSVSSRVDGSVLPHNSCCTTFPHRISLATDAVETSWEPILVLDHADARYPKHILRCAFLVDPQLGLSDPRAGRALCRIISNSRLHGSSSNIGTPTSTSRW
ncbi:hypothetical protein ABH945_007019 [Paraburkholderia sp. GAS333]